MRKWLQAATWEVVSLLLSCLIGMLYFDDRLALSSFVITITLVKIPLLYGYNLLWEK